MNVGRITFNPTPMHPTCCAVCGRAPHTFKSCRTCIARYGGKL